MILAVRDACDLHEHVKRADPAPEIDDLVDALAAADSTEAASRFFGTNHVTGGMRLLLEYSATIWMRKCVNQDENL